MLTLNFSDPSPSRQVVSCAIRKTLGELYDQLNCEDGHVCDVFKLGIRVVFTYFVILEEVKGTTDLQSSHYASCNLQMTEHGESNSF